MNQNVFIFLMLVWALCNFSACGTLILRRCTKTIQQQQKWKRVIKSSVFLNLGTMIVFSDSLVENFGLLLLMIGNIFLSSWSIKAVCRQYEKQLRRQKFAFRVDWIKHNIAYGTVEIDGIKYHAFIPPVWMNEYQDENGRLVPGTFKKYPVRSTLSAQFKRFVPVYGDGMRPMVELG